VQSLQRELGEIVKSLASAEEDWLAAHEILEEAQASI